MNYIFLVNLTELPKKWNSSCLKNLGEAPSKYGLEINTKKGSHLTKNEKGKPRIHRQEVKYKWY